MRISFLMLLFCGTLSAQAYTVSDGSGAYPSIVGATWLTAAHDDATAEISPTGFSFDYFGQAFSSFRICTNGCIQLGNGSFGFSAAKTPDHAAYGNVIACLWADLIVSPSSSALRWKFDGTVLYVEWQFVLQEFGPAYQPIPFPGVNMQAQLDTSTGTITFWYGDPSPLAGTVTGIAGAVAISSAAGAGQQVIAGTMAGHVATDGAVSLYPVNRWIRFDPPANSAPVIGVSADGANVTNAQTLTVPLGSSLADAGLQISVSDADGDAVALSSTVSNAAASGILEAEFAHSGATPYALAPVSGSFGALVTHTITLQADDGNGGVTSFSFTIQVADSAGGFTAGAGSGGGGGCSMSGATGVWLVLLAAAGFAACRRRAVVSRPR
jgi:hypothetical protein